MKRRDHGPRSWILPLGRGFIRARSRQNVGVQGSDPETDSHTDLSIRRASPDELNRGRGTREWSDYPRPCNERTGTPVVPTAWRDLWRQTVPDSVGRYPGRGQETTAPICDAVPSRRRRVLSLRRGHLDWWDVDWVVPSDPGTLVVEVVRPPFVQGCPSVETHSKGVGEEKGTDWRTNR